MVLAMIVAFFAVIIGVNGFMAHEALSTFRGVDTDSAYRAGQLFEHEVALAKAQDAEHWQVDAKVTPSADGTALLDVVAHDASGAPLSGMTATAVFARPTDRHLDRTVIVNEDKPGHYPAQRDRRRGPMGSHSRTVTPGRSAVPIQKSRRNQVSVGDGRDC